MAVLINSIILAFIIFMMVKSVNRLRRQQPPVPEAIAEEIVLLREISAKLGNNNLSK